MTKYLTMEPQPKPEGKKTVFHKHVLRTVIEPAYKVPDDYNNVMFLWHDEGYGDVFAAWGNNPSNRTIFFGEKGDEFHQE